jgi:hypothetical protein
LIGVAVPPGSKVKLPAELVAADLPIVGAAFASATVVPTARPAPMTVAAAMAA